MQFFLVNLPAILEFAFTFSKAVKLEKRINCHGKSYSRLTCWNIITSIEKQFIKIYLKIWNKCFRIFEEMLNGKVVISRTNNFWANIWRRGSWIFHGWTFIRNRYSWVGGHFDFKSSMLVTTFCRQIFPWYEHSQVVLLA